ncbi:hypothetical protein [Amycolatopsis japonica]
MSGFGKWNLGIGAVLMAAAVLCSKLDLIDGWSERADLRRREARVLREREGRQDH